MTQPIEIVGDLVAIYPVEEISDKFRKRKFKVYVENKKNTKYSDIFILELKQDKCELIDQYEIGELIECKCSLSGRDWVDSQGRPVYDTKGRQINSTTINCWFITVPGKEGTLSEKDPDENDELTSEKRTFANMPDDDLPF